MKYKKISQLILYIFFLLLFTELLSFIYVKSNKYISSPNYNFYQRTHYLDINEYFGPWHLSNTSFNHITGCFNVNYKFNSIGARDEEFIKNISNRAMLVGDSFAESYGLDKDYRVDSLLEKKLDLDVLNFGVSGHFGTTQTRLLYEYFEGQYDHKYIFHLLHVPSDFEDDDYNFGTNNRNTSNRYRPYLIKRNGNYEELYSGTFNKNIKNGVLDLKSFLANFTYTFYTLKDLKETISKFKKKEVPVQRINYYENYKSEILDIFKYNFDEINKIANNKQRKYIIILMPDFDHLKSNKNDTSLYKELIKFVNKEDILLIDLLREIKNNKIDIQKMFNNNDEYDCDGHPNEFGAKIIAELIASNLKQNNIIK